MTQNNAGDTSSMITHQHQWLRRQVNWKKPQLKYCANDVIYLHRIHNELNKILIREKRLQLYKDKPAETKAEEVIALFADAVATGDIKYNENFRIWNHTL